MPRRFRSRIALPPSSSISPERGEQRGRERVARLAAQVDDLHRRQRRADPPAQVEALEQLPALRARRRAAVDDDRALERAALGRDRARVVARIRVLLVGRVVLLVDADEPEPLDRREDRRARADDDAGLPGRDPLALVAALRLRQARMEHRHAVSEPSAEARRGLRRQRDLGDEDDRAEPARERLLAGAEVDLRLAAPGRPVEEQVCGRRRARRRSARAPRLARARAPRGAPRRRPPPRAAPGAWLRRGALATAAQPGRGCARASSRSGRPSKGRGRRVRPEPTRAASRRRPDRRLRASRPRSPRRRRAG